MKMLEYKEQSHYRQNDDRHINEVVSHQPGPRPETPPTPLTGLYFLSLAVCFETAISLVEKAIIQ